MRKEIKTVSVSTLMRRAREAKTKAEAKRLRAKAAELRKAARGAKGGIERNQDPLWRVKSAGARLSVGGMVGDAAAPLNPAPTPEQIAWERGREEGRREARVESRNGHVRAFIQQIDDRRDDGDTSFHLPAPLVFDIIELLWSFGFGADVAKSHQPKG